MHMAAGPALGMVKAMFGFGGEGAATSGEEKGREDL